MAGLARATEGLEALPADAGCGVASRPGESPRDLAPDPPDLAIQRVRVFDGTSVIGSATVEIKAGKITRITENLHVTDAIVRVDGSGMTLLPGLIDSHTHIQSPDALRQALAFGVTTELDMFTLPSLLRPLRKLADGRDGAALADFRSAGILATAPGATAPSTQLPHPHDHRPRPGPRVCRRPHRPGLPLHQDRLRRPVRQLKYTTIPAAEWAKVEEEAQKFWDEIAAESEIKAKIVGIIKKYNETMVKAAPPYRYA